MVRKRKPKTTLGRFCRHYYKRKQANTLTQSVRSQSSPYKSPFFSPIKSPTSGPWKSPAAKKMRLGKNHGLITRKLSYKSPLKTFQNSPFKESVKSPLHQPRYSATKERNNCKNQNKSLRQLFKNSENECSGDFTPISLSTLSASDNEIDDLLQDFPNEDKSEHYTKSNYEDIEHMKDLLPKVMENLSKSEMDKVLLKFFEMVASGSFPQDNIAFLLWAEVVKWFDMPTTTRMRYCNETKLFWKLGWRLFGRRFLNFMGGFKSHGEIQLNVCEKGQFDPQSAEINFAVPDVSVLRAFDPYHISGAQPPGIFDKTIKNLSKSLVRKSACLTFDGKKLKLGLTESTGDVDLLGQESGKTLAMKRQILGNEVKMVTDIERQIRKMNEEGINTYEDMKSELKDVLEFSLSNLSSKINEITQLKEKKSYCKKKLIERSGDVDWRKGRYAFAISSVTAFIYELEEYLSTSKNVIDNVCRLLASFNGGNYVDGNQVKLETNTKYVSVDDQKLDQECPINTRLLQQRSSEWHAIRKEAKVTGSTLYAAVGCDGLCKQKDHFENVICGVSPKDPPESVRQAMKHGTENEINAVGTLVGKVAPVMFPDLLFCEEGCSVVRNETNETFMVVSPDGSLRRSKEMDSTEVAVEIKCPVRAVHTTVPERYVLQCLAEMFALNVEHLLYVSWTEDITTVFKMSRNDVLLQRALSICMEIYRTEHPRKPTKLSHASKDLKEDIRKEAESAKFVGIFPSCHVVQEEHELDKKNHSNEDVSILLKDICKLHNQCYELQRERATEAVVFLIGDLDRSWKRNTIRCSPVGWFTKCYSLDALTMRKIAENVHTQCTESGIHVPCQSFDGQWHTLVVRDVEGEQLQKDIWRRVEQRSKKDLIDEIKQLNKDVLWTVIPSTGSRSKYISLTNGGRILPMFKREARSKPKELNEEDENHSVTALIDLVPDIVQETTDIGREVLLATSVTDELELEAFSQNTDANKWCTELQLDDIQQITDNEKHINESETEKIDENNNDEFTLDCSDMERILKMLKTTKDCNKKMQWNTVTPNGFLDYFQSYQKLCTLLDIEIRVIVRYLKKAKGMTNVKESSSKQTKLDKIANFLCLVKSDSTHKTVSSKKGSKFHVSSLHDLATKVVSKYSKHELNVIVAEMTFPEMYKTWMKPIDDVTVNGESQQRFYKPEYSKRRKQTEVKCIDSTHLLTRARRKTCAGGIQGISNEPWMKVARQRKTLLTAIMVEDVSDPMSVAMAKTHFSESVEIEMRKNGDSREADLVNDIRSWWEAEDSPGISSVERIQKRKNLRRRLFDLVDFTSFPPPTQYVCGWPVQLWEALLASIDAKTYLYSLVHGGCYNVRAFSSLIGETYFSEVTLNDKRGHGTISALEFSQYMGHSTEQLQIRLDNNRHFSYCTSKTKVYDIVDESYECDDDDDDACKQFCRICLGDSKSLPSDICIRDHVFDSIERKRLAGRRKADTIPSDRNAILKGSLGVRWEKARCNMSKMLPCKRMGITDE